ncbi:hypothetical protein Barb6XT_02387 [Bacteroidales bacterium Barb6XT]|nr:hypothetical protein Barb6XT_02387 [Bacteroidales bacterium Barb6XT]
MADSIGRKDVDFNASQELITTAALLNSARWKLIDSWILEVLLPAKSKWEEAWKAYQNRKTRNSNITSAKNQARKKYEPILRTLVATLTADPLVTDTDLNSMGIVGRHKSGAPIPVPTTYPKTEIKLPAPAKIELHFRDNGETGHAKPHGVRGAEIRWAILETPPTDWDELQHSEFDTQSPFTLTFKGGERAKTVYFALRWENTTGEKGPWAEIQSAVIP